MDHARPRAGDSRDAGTGVYLLWIAVAAILTGILTFAVDPGLPMQIVSFAFLSLIMAFSAKRILRDTPIVSSDPLLNNRVGRLIGETAQVSAAIEGGCGRVHLGDSDWMAEGPDLPVGSRVRITGSRGTILLVEPVALLPDSQKPPT